MQRKYLIIAGIALALLLVAGGTSLVLLRPWEAPGPSSTGAAPPGSLRVEAGDTEVALTWQPVDGAHGYFVYRDGGKAPLNPTPVTETSYDDIGLSNGRAYRYEVAPVDAAGTPGKRTAQVQIVPTSR
jgi:hypothetical protein